MYKKGESKMDERELKVIIQNVLKYEDKSEKGKYKSRLGYFLDSSDAYQETDKYKGIAELSYFGNDTQIFDKLSIKHMGKSATLVFKKVANVRNPLKDSSKLIKIMFKDETVDIL